jgi:hypothetical protein
VIFFRLYLILARSTSHSVQSYALWLESARLGAYFRERKRSSHLRDEMIEPSVNGRTGSENNETLPAMLLRAVCRSICGPHAF